LQWQQQLWHKLLAAVLYIYFFFFLERHAANEFSGGLSPSFSPQTDCINYQQIIFAAQKATFISDYAWTKESGSLDSGLRMLHNSRVASVARHMLLPLADASVDAMWIEMAILTWSRTNLSERSRASVHSAKNYK